MNHGVYGKKLSRTKNERRLLFRNLVREFADHGAIVTTQAKAKAVQPLIEKLITKAKRQTEHDRRGILSVMTDRVLVAKFIDDVVVRCANRSSGYTRLVKAGLRRGDGTMTVMLSYTDAAPVRGQVVKAETKPEKKSAGTKKSIEEKRPKKQARK